MYFNGGKICEFFTKDFFSRGKTGREVLSPYISLKSRITGIPEDQIKVSDLYEVGAGTTAMSIPDFKKMVYKSEDYRKSDNFKSRGLGDLVAISMISSFIHALKGIFTCVFLFGFNQ